jgi:hypothetical protein
MMPLPIYRPPALYCKHFADFRHAAQANGWSGNDAHMLQGLTVAYGQDLELLQRLETYTTFAAFEAMMTLEFFPRDKTRVLSLISTRRQGLINMGARVTWEPVTAYASALSTLPAALFGVPPQMLMYQFQNGLAPHLQAHLTRSTRRPRPTTSTRWPSLSCLSNAGPTRTTRQRPP